ncbi:MULTISPECIES: DUF1187 family protein [Enterobacter cloacae complex]
MKALDRGRNKMYKIEAVIHKPGNAPTHWVRYSDKTLNLKQCRDLITPVKSSGKFQTTLSTPKITEFSCTKIA